VGPRVYQRAALRTDNLSFGELLIAVRAV
jgi:hypothetical protein